MDRILRKFMGASNSLILAVSVWRERSENSASPVVYIFCGSLSEIQQGRQEIIQKLADNAHP